ncbi:arylamine N-acetyltransferase family protein [Legionella gresilensis]|uniref:arylamine N-acetyltransferase family protein n=1 Tax=Legionella gresilensis TaxID=91823 RepID=UPI001F5EA3DE|nr:arylamine N-acetyltransferase [Legionella gresilensis]
MINLKSYFKKINISEKSLVSLPSKEQLEFLEEIYFAHLKTFPYENFELRLIAKQHLLKRQSLNFFSYDKLLTDNRGGYCYQTAMLLYDALTQIGFSVKPCIGRILNGAPVNDPKILELPPTHMLLVVRIGNQEFFLDPGLGSSAPRRPILITNSEQLVSQYPDQYKLYPCGNFYILERKVEDKWTRLLQTDLQEASIKQLQNNLLKLERHPSTLPIRDEKTLVGVITNEGHKVLIWDIASNALKFSKQIGELYIKETLSNFEIGQKKLVEEFNIHYISVSALESYCKKIVLPKPIHPWDINLPIEETELASLEKNLSLV